MNAQALAPHAPALARLADALARLAAEAARDGQKESDAPCQERRLRTEDGGSSEPPLYTAI